MRAVRPRQVAEALPLIKFSLKIDVSFVVEKLSEFLLVGSVRSFHLSIQLKRAGFDVGVADAFVFDIPVKLGLKLVAIVGPDLAYPERELRNRGSDLAATHKWCGELNQTQTLVLPELSWSYFVKWHQKIELQAWGGVGWKRKLPGVSWLTLG